MGLLKNDTTRWQIWWPDLGNNPANLMISDYVELSCYTDSLIYTVYEQTSKSAPSIYN